MLKVWKALGYIQTQFLHISFLMRNGTIKWIKLKILDKCFEFFFTKTVYLQMLTDIEIIRKVWL